MFNSTIITGVYTAIEGLRLLLVLEHPDQTNVFLLSYIVIITPYVSEAGLNGLLLLLRIIYVQLIRNNDESQPQGWLSVVI